jgi:single-stranded-DNA-specific exonuclease
VNKQRQDMCARIEQEADRSHRARYSSNIKTKSRFSYRSSGCIMEYSGLSLRLVERYGVPVFIGTNEDEHHIR